MSCHSCKSKNKPSIVVTNKRKTNIVLRILYFILGIIVIFILLPIVGLVGIYMLYKSMILDEPTEILPSITFLGKLLTKEDPTEDDDNEELDMDDDNFNPEDYELLNVEEIKSK